jgi:hypothetical protein
MLLRHSRPRRDFASTTFLSMASPSFPSPRSFAWVWDRMIHAMGRLRRQARQGPRKVANGTIGRPVGRCMALPALRRREIRTKYVRQIIFSCCTVYCCCCLLAHPLELLFEQQEEMYLQEAIRQSLQDDAKAAAAAPGVASAPPTGDLLDLMAPEPVPAHAAANAFAGALVPASSSGYYGGTSNPYALVPTAGSPYGGGPPAYGAPAAGNPYGPPLTAADPYGMPLQPQNPYGAPVSGDPFAKPPPDATANPYAVGSYDAPQSVPSANPYAAQPANPYAPPPAATNPYAAPAQNAYAPAPAASNPYAPDSFAVPTLAGNPYGTAPAPTNPYGSAPPAAASGYPYASGAPEQYKQPGLSFAAPAENHYPSNPYSTPGADMKTNGRQMMMNGDGDVPHDVGTPRGDQTPSSLGFGSPPADFSGFSPMPEEQKLATTIGGSKADQAYFKLANLDTFSLASKNDEERLNPFETGSITETRSLADIAKTKPRSNTEIMKSHAVVVSNNQLSYGSQYGIAPQQQPPQPPMGQQMYGQPQAQYGQPPNPYGQQPQPQFGQQAPQGGQSQQQYGQPNVGFGGSQPQAQYGQAAAPYGGQQQQQQQQPPYGQPQQPAFEQPQQPAFGQPQQPAFGQPPQQQQQQPFNQPPMMQPYGAAPQYGQQFGNQGY